MNDAWTPPPHPGTAPPAERPAPPAPRAHQAPRAHPAPRAHRAWMVFFLVIIAGAGLAFGFKFYEFFVDLSSHEGFRFAGAHLATYLLVATGFFLLLGFAFLKGHFNDVERPKHELLEREIRHDRAEFDTTSR